VRCGRNVKREKELGWMERKRYPKKSFEKGRKVHKIYKKRFINR